MTPERFFLELEPREQRMKSWPHVVIVGGGFAGIKAARRLAGREVRVTLVIGEEEDPQVRLGRDFALHGELVDQLAQLPGLGKVSLRPVAAAARLRLVA